MFKTRSLNSNFSHVIQSISKSSNSLQTLCISAFPYFCLFSKLLSHVNQVYNIYSQQVFVPGYISFFIPLMALFRISLSITFAPFITPNISLIYFFATHNVPLIQYYIVITPGTGSSGVFLQGLCGQVRGSLTQPMYHVHLQYKVLPHMKQSVIVTYNTVILP